MSIRLICAALLALTTEPLLAQSTFARSSGPPAGSRQERALARSLARLGEVAITRENDAAIDAYFSPAYIFHGPDGDINLTELKAGFAAMRAAFSNFKMNSEVMLVQGNFMSTRTIMSGVFTGPYTTPYGILAPTGRAMKRTNINVLRFDERGKLAEEWLQYNEIGFLRQLGVELVPKR